MLNMLDTETRVKKSGMRGVNANLRKARKKQSDRAKRINTVNLERVKECAALGMTQAEIADRIHVSPDWLSKHKETDRELAEALDDGFGNFKEGLRRTQAKLALSGHPGMLIWLGKQFLGQSDKQESKQETTVSVVLQSAMKEVGSMSDSDLMELKEIFERNNKPLTIENQ